MPKKHPKHLIVFDSKINIVPFEYGDYICLTDMVRNIGGSALIESWLRKKNTIEYLGVWEKLNNPLFNSVEFDGIKSQAGSNRFVISAKQWVELTGAKGISARAGRYGGTYAHTDIAFEFATWISPEFKFLIIKEFQKFKIQSEKNAHWDYHRFLSKVNYRLQTSAVKNILIPFYKESLDKRNYLYAEEADIVNLAVFGITALEWRRTNSKLAKKGENIRDYANIEQLTVLANLESINSMLISNGIDKEQRFAIMTSEAVRQLEALGSIPGLNEPEKRLDFDKKLLN
jgi:hypothetical protein